MNINLLALGLMVLAFGVHFGYAYLQHKGGKAPNELPWVPIQVGKSRSFVNQVRDAGMFTERTRRVAIIGANTCGVGANPQRSFWNKSFSNGVMETFLTAICPAVFTAKPICPPEPQQVALDGGDSTNDSCEVVYDGNSGELFDFGDSIGNVCSL
jgi:hypothetical protein